MAPVDFVDALSSMYLDAPGHTLPNALWKTREIVPSCQTRLAVDARGQPSHMELWQGDRLFVYWNRSGRLQIPGDRLSHTSFALLHDDYAPAFPLDDFMERERYFRLTYRHPPEIEPVPAPLPAGFGSAPVGIADAPGPAAAHVSRFIGRCYDDLHPPPATVVGWRDHPTFSPNLWLWLVDSNRGQPAALGIAEYDAVAAEGSLEWIQVLPAYRRRGLGTALVETLLARLQHLGARFTTVGGRLENATRPDAVYRRCGFTGNDRWWVLRR